jgi:HEAT repeat protein
MMNINRSFLLPAVACLAMMSAARVALAAAPTNEAVQAIADLLGDSDKDVRALGLQQVREGAKGAEATKQFAALLPKLAPNIQAELLAALATRGDKAARPAILDCLKSKEPPVRTAAILALGPLGESADVPLLTEQLATADKERQNAAQTSLLQLCGPSINSVIAAELKPAEPELRMALIRILESRRAADNVADIHPYISDGDAGVRTAAMAALGQLAAPKDVARMVPGVLKAKPGAEREAAEKAVMFVCNREKNAEKRTAPLLAAWKNLSEDEKNALLPTLGRVGGSEPRKLVEAAMADAVVERREAAVRALCNWPDASVAPRLVELVQNAKNAADRRAAEQALARVAALPDKRSAAERLALLKTAMSLAASDEERNYVLKRAKAVRTVETLRFVVPFLSQPEYAQEACVAVVELAHHRALRDANKAEFDKALDVVIHTSKDAEIVDRATRYKKGQTRLFRSPTAAK